MLSPRTERDYRNYILRWERAGCPDPAEWLPTLTPNAWRNARAALRWHDPTLALPRPPRMRAVPRPLSQLETETLRTACYAEHEWLGATFDLLYATGLRITEACSLTEDDLRDGYIIVSTPKRDPGGGVRERVVPVSRLASHAITVLRKRKGATLVGVTPNRVEELFRKVGQQVGIRLYPHRLRHTFCTHLLQAGADIITVKELAGHRDLTTTLRYLATTDERKRKAIELLG